MQFLFFQAFNAFALAGGVLQFPQALLPAVGSGGDFDGLLLYPFSSCIDVILEQLKHQQRTWFPLLLLKLFKRIRQFYLQTPENFLLLQKNASGLGEFSLGLFLANFSKIK